jgi:hypothetical protein
LVFTGKYCFREHITGKDVQREHRDLPDQEDRRTLEDDLKELSEAARYFSREQKSNTSTAEIKNMNLEARARHIASNLIA